MGICNISCSVTEYDLDVVWPRDMLFCQKCGSSVRERGLHLIMSIFYPNYKSLIMHESSPCNERRIFQELIKNDGYSYSQYFPEVKNGDFKNGIQCANIEDLPFESNSFDLFITLDVLEHIFDPAKCFKEVYQSLKPGGAFIFTVPMDAGNHPTEKVASKDGDVVEILPTKVGRFKGASLDYPEFHGNPADPNGSLLTYYWGYDIVEFIKQNSDFDNVQIFFKNGDAVESGIAGVMDEVIICIKGKNDEITEVKKEYYKNI